LSQIEDLGLKKASLEFDVTLARGLNYYTGAIFEVKANGVDMGSICGGGRYDDLTGIFGLKDVSGVGISFGADRIYDVMNELELFPETSEETTQILFLNFGDEEAKYSLGLLKQCREADINSEIYPSSVKMKKQMNYADQKGIKYVAMVGSDEMETGTIRIKEMSTGEQSNLTIDELINQIK
jgi:histidyl-tRNA synthetase